MTLATYHDWAITPPSESSDEIVRWYATAQNFAVEMIWGAAGSSFRGSSDVETCLITAAGGAVIRAEHSGASEVIDGEAFTVLGPGDYQVEVLEAGRLFHLVDARSGNYGRIAAIVPASTDPRVVPPGTDVHRLADADIRVYRLSGYADLEDRKRIFMTQNFMVNMVRSRDQARDPREMSPHSHTDFQQATLVVEGRFVHHMRRPWGKDSLLWEPDEHVEVGAPSLTVIPPQDVHTLRNVGHGPWQHIDVFNPPRRDFWDRGLVLNDGDYKFQEQ